MEKHADLKSAVIKPAHRSDDDFLRSPSVPRFAGLRFNFVVAAPEGSKPLRDLTPQFLRALHLELFTKSSFCRLFTSSSVLSY
jgi:hypothetical protein